MTGRAKLMFDLTQLALRNDSTRMITIMTEGYFIVPHIFRVRLTPITWQEYYRTEIRRDPNKGKSGKQVDWKDR